MSETKPSKELPTVAKELPAVAGEIYRKGKKVYLKVDGRLYGVHLWDVEKYEPRSKEKAEGVLFKFKHPAQDQSVMVHGWVYPGTLKLTGSQVPPAKAGGLRE